VTGVQTCALPIYRARRRPVAFAPKPDRLLHLLRHTAPIEPMRLRVFARKRVLAIADRDRAAGRIVVDEDSLGLEIVDRVASVLLEGGPIATLAARIDLRRLATWKRRRGSIGEHRNEPPDGVSTSALARRRSRRLHASTLPGGRVLHDREIDVMDEAHAGRERVRRKRLGEAKTSSPEDHRRAPRASRLRGTGTRVVAHLDLHARERVPD